ncbi:MAG: hypothetical protein ACFE9L_20835 [Candidatus Hodarchaeota archaeon]
MNIQLGQDWTSKCTYRLPVALKHYDLLKGLYNIMKVIGHSLELFIAFLDI